MVWYVIVGLLLVGLAIAVVKLFYDVFIIIFKEIKSFTKGQKPLKPVHREILLNYSAYYRLLSATDKKRFEKRLQRFMHSKEFIPRIIKVVTDEMRVLVSASAIQLTFGLPQVYLANFKRILIYPDSYYSNITRQYHVGEVNPRAGIIVLSWKSFVDGYNNSKDSLNVGIHEMAHAIHFENRIKNKEYDFLDYQGLQKLAEITQREVPLIRQGNGHFFRDYAATNVYEFFAVSLEYFFEQPVEFSKAIPDLYDTLKKLLNQDPIRLYGGKVSET